MSQETRRNFEQWKVEVVYRLQDGCCAKCGATLQNGFHRDHKDGHHTNNSVDNLRLFCPKCHGGEQYETLQKQKKQHLEELKGIIAMGQGEKASGTVIDKLVEAIKLALTLERQVYGADIEYPPASVKIETDRTVFEYGLKQYEEGVKEGILKGLETISNVVHGGKKK
jgi:hypothetical protein